MRSRFFDLAFTPSVCAEQTRHGSRDAFARRMADAAGADEAPAGLTGAEATFLMARDSFYLASVSETGWPYLQHRGGPAGFVKVLGPTTIGWAEFRGNRQYVSAGNAASDGRVSLFAMDYAHRRRLKVLGRLRFEDAAARPDLVEALSVPGYRAAIESVATVEVEAFDWNCPQHITERYTMAEIEAAVAPLRARLAELEARLGASSEAGAAPAA